MKFKLSLAAVLASMALTLFPGTSRADTVLDPLHGCIIGTSCADNGTVTPTTINPLPAFTFTDSPGPGTGDLLIEVLVPNNEDPVPTGLSFSISGTAAGPTDTGTVSGSSTLEGDWTTLQLQDFLGLSASPSNPLSAWLAYTQGNNCGASQNSACDAGATGYEVYQVDLGNNELQSPSNPVAPILTLSGSTLPIASVLAGFLGNGSTFKTSTSFIATAPSGGIFEAGGGTPPPPPPAVPEPSSLILFGTGTLSLIGMWRRKRLAL
jgi:hypothetical protein